MKKRFSHLAHGEVHMVDVGGKAETERVAIARAFVRMQPATLKLIRANRVGKGNVLTTAQIAGMNAAMRTAELIPLCHPIPLSYVGVEFDFLRKPCGVVIVATAVATAKTGVEMEALTAVSVAALTIYDMCKSADRAMSVSHVELMYKAGGKSGAWKRGNSPSPLVGEGRVSGA